MESKYTGFTASQFENDSLSPYKASRKRHTMNSVTNHHAGTKAGRAARCALRAALACALVLGASGSAFAQQYGDRQYDRRDDPSLQQSGRGEHGGRDPRYDVRAYEEQ